MQSKTPFFIALIFISIIVMCACQPLQTTIPATPEIETEAPEATLQRTPTQKSKEADPTYTPKATPLVPSKPGTPLPTTLEVITVDNAEQIQHLATWGIGSPTVIQLSQDGQVLALGTGLGVHFYDTQGLYEIAFRETSHIVISISFSSDNEFVAISQAGGHIAVYDRIDFSLEKNLEFSDFPLQDSYDLDCFFLQEDAKLICAVRTEGRIFITQWSTDDWVRNISFSIDNGLTSFINPDIGSIGVINQEGLLFQSMLFMEETKRIELPSTLSEAFWKEFVVNDGDIAPTADGESLLINNGSSIIHWEILSDEITYQLRDYPASLPDPCQDVAETCLNEDGEISWVCQEEVPPPIETIALTPDDIMVIISRNDEVLEFRRIHEGLLAWEINAAYTKIIFSPGSEFFFALQENGLVEKRSSETGTLLGVIDHYPGKLLDIAFSPSGDEIAAAGNNNWIHIYNTVEGLSLGVLEGNAHSLDFSPDGSLLAAGLEDGTTRIFTLDNGGHFDLEGHTDSVNGLKFSEDGRILLSGSSDCTISLWDIIDRDRTKTITPGKNQPFEVLQVDFSPAEVLGYMVGDISGLYAAKEDGKYLLEGFVSVRDFAVSENKQTVAVTGSGTSIFTEIQEEGFFTSHSLSVKGNALALNKDGSLLVVATEESLEFWSTESRSGIHTIPLKDTNIAGKSPIRLSFSPKNGLIAVGYQNGLIEIFGVPSN